MDKKNSPTQSYLKYSGIAFQLAALIGISYYLGNKVDIYFEHKTPFIAILSTLIVFGLYMYKLYIELFNKSK